MHGLSMIQAINRNAHARWETQEVQRAALAGFCRYLQGMHHQCSQVYLKEEGSERFVQVSMGQMAQVLTKMIENPQVGRLEMMEDGSVAVPANSPNAEPAVSTKAA